MKKKALVELHSKTKEELKNLLKEEKALLFNLKLEKSQKKLKNVASIVRKRKDIARINTIINQKEQGDSV